MTHSKSICPEGARIRESGIERVCAWCGERIGDDPHPELSCDDTCSHGLCPTCADAISPDGSGRGDRR